MPDEKREVQVQFRGLEEQIDQRGDNRNFLAKRDLERYYDLLARTLRTVDLSEPEASLIVDACNGVLHEPMTIHLFWAGVDDAMQLDNLHVKWNVNEQDLTTKLRSLSPAQTYAVVDATERFWTLVRNGEESSNQEKLRAVGLIR